MADAEFCTRHGDLRRTERRQINAPRPGKAIVAEAGEYGATQGPVFLSGTLGEPPASVPSIRRDGEAPRVVKGAPPRREASKVHPGLAVGPTVPRVVNSAISPERSRTRRDTWSIVLERRSAQGTTRALRHHDPRRAARYSLVVGGYEARPYHRNRACPNQVGDGICVRLFWHRSSSPAWLEAWVSAGRSGPVHWGADGS